jgi:hypothetical protein
MVHLFTVDSRWPSMLQAVRDQFVRSGSETLVTGITASSGR